MLFTNALAMLTIHGEIRRLGHTRQPSDVPHNDRADLTELAALSAETSIASSMTHLQTGSLRRQRHQRHLAGFAKRVMLTPSMWIIKRSPRRSLLLGDRRPSICTRAS